MPENEDYEIENPKPTSAGVEQTRRWFANLHANVPAAINYANTPFVTPGGEIIFNIRDNGQVWTYDLH
jgi:hypothetical protein